MNDPADDPAADIGLEFPFVGILSFLRSPICTDLARLDAMIAVMGVPTDEGSPFMGVAPRAAGAARAFAALRRRRRRGGIHSAAGGLMRAAVSFP